MASHHPLVLIILDGFGYREETSHNAIALANTPNFDKWWQDYPHTLITGSGQAVGLPKGQMGNSEVGHLNMGAGRVVQQDFTRIDSEIDNGRFKQNPVFCDAFDELAKNQHALHILGLLSPGGVHSHEKQIHALIELAAARNIQQIYLHAFLDGRDCAPKSATASIQSTMDLFKQLGIGKIASICGRYYAMDRDQRWDRVQQAYDLLTLGQADFHAKDALAALQLAYDRGETDEFVKATSIDPSVKINEGDLVVFMNYRADRARQLTRALTANDFNEFNRQAVPKLQSMITLTEYSSDFNLPIAYQPIKHQNVLGEYISDRGLSQLRIAETEKYAHVTFFFNGGVETPFTKEKRVLIPSPKVATYDLQPEMSIYELADAFVKEMNANDFAMVICNIANADMVGHTGKLDAAIKAIEAIDECLGKMVQCVKAKGGEVLITADHGNAECMENAITHQPHTAHTSEPVPFLYIGRHATVVKSDGALQDVAPTMLTLLGLPIPAEMTGRAIFEIKD